MSCSDFDIRGYFLEELTPDETAAVQRHLPGCQECREELSGLETTHAALLSVPDEEVPQRIAFVSDKVFEPNWWQRFWRSVPRLGFASAAMLSAAIFVHAFTRPAPVTQPAGIDQAAVRQIVEKEVSQRLDAAVAQAVALAEEKNEERTAELLHVAAERYEIERRADMLMVEESFDYLRKQLSVAQMAAYRGVSQ
jgi:anti-sigma factor RsiW